LKMENWYSYCPRRRVLVNSDAVLLNLKIGTVVHVN
jgi:hypothetical protein